MRWPGAVYDGKKALETYRKKNVETAKQLGMKAQLREIPIHSLAEADEWISRVKTTRPDGLLVVLLDRQQHSWPTAYKAVSRESRLRSW